MTSELKSMFGENIPEQTTQIHRNSKKILEKKKKDLVKKHRGMKRELMKLIPISSIVERAKNKDLKNNSNWVWAPFSNPARTDNLKLVHWQRAEDVNKDYDFAKLNQSIDIIEFTKEEYDKLIKPNDRNWNYEQTCYLWELIKRYELRFIVIMDRFDEEKYGERTVESLKDRYYSVARIILENRKMFEHPIIKSGYNYEQEMKRRTYLEKTMNKTFAELREEQDLFEMNDNLNKKTEKYEKLNELKLPTFSSENQTNAIKHNNNTIQIPMNIDETDNINNNQLNVNENSNSKLNHNRINIDHFSTKNENNQTFEEFIKNNITTNDSFVYLRSQKLKHNLPVSEKIQERVDNYMKEFNIEKLIPTAKVEIVYDNLRNNIIIYTSLKKYLEKKDKEYIFLQTNLKEYQNKKNPKNIQNIYHRSNKSNSKSEKHLNQLNKSNIKVEDRNEIKEEDSNSIPNINNYSKIIDSSEAYNEENSIDQETINNNDDSISHDTKEKRKKVRKRKHGNDEEITTEEKEQNFSFKKRKRGINK